MKAPLFLGVLGLVSALSAHAQSRGELLYSTHCVACHTAQMHWRDRRAATDWQGILAQVRKWQGAASLSWSEQDVDAVARYLNDSFYHFALPPLLAGASTPTVQGKPR
jgi:mono/diheme cytochrome c family protein